MYQCYSEDFIGLDNGQAFVFRKYVACEFLKNPDVSFIEIKNRFDLQHAHRRGKSGQFVNLLP